MPRLRTKRESFVNPSAAEVLEHRALLSAGAALAQHVVQGAGHTHDLAPAAKTQVSAQFAFSNGDTTGTQASVSWSKFKVALGDHNTLHFSAKLDPHFTIKGTISGVVTNFVVGKGDATITLSPGGKIVEKLPNHTHTTLSPTGPMSIVIGPDNTLDSFDVHYNVLNSQPALTCHLTAT